MSEWDNVSAAESPGWISSRLKMLEKKFVDAQHEAVYYDARPFDEAEQSRLWHVAGITRLELQRFKLIYLGRNKVLVDGKLVDPLTLV